MSLEQLEPREKRDAMWSLSQHQAVVASEKSCITGLLGFSGNNFDSLCFNFSFLD